MCVSGWQKDSQWESVLVCDDDRAFVCVSSNGVSCIRMHSPFLGR